MADQGLGCVLTDGSGYIYGVYKIDSIDENKNNFVDVGVARKIDFNIKITRTDDEK